MGLWLFVLFLLSAPQKFPSARVLSGICRNIRQGSEAQSGELKKYISAFQCQRGRGKQRVTSTILWEPGNPQVWTQPSWFWLDSNGSLSVLWLISKIFIFIFKLLDGLAPQYLADLLSHPIRSLWAVGQLHMVVPKSCLKTRGLSVVAPKLGNRLPLHIKRTVSLSAVARLVSRGR